MITTRTRTLLVLLFALAALLSSEAAAEAPAGQPLIAAGPTGRIALSDWTLREDPANRGLSLGWKQGNFSGRRVSVPNDVDPHAFSGSAGTVNYEGSVAWYRTSLQAAEGGLYALDFQSANFLASVWVDGHLLGSHRGSYLPFQLRARLAAGTHTVVVRVDWRDPAAQTREGFHRTWFNWGGLNGEVELQPIGSSVLSEPAIRTTLDSQTGAARVEVSVELSNEAGARTLTPEGSLAHGSQTVALQFAPVTLAHGESRTITATAEVAEPALWSPVAPNLYQLTLTVPNESGYSASVGLRDLSWHGGRIYLNGSRLLLHGATIQEDSAARGDALSPSDENAIVRELKAIGANVARAQHPLDPALLERLDAAGILVWQGVGPVEGAGNWYSRSPALLARAEGAARTAIVADQLHPAIIAWNLVDEVAGDGHDPYEVAYVHSLGRWIHAHDPTRMVAIDVWGDHPPKQAGAIYAGADAIAETDYSGWYDYPKDSPAELAAAMRARLAAMQRTFAGRVLVISEFGAESNGLNASSAPGGYAFQTRLLSEHVAVYRADPGLSGMMIWLLRDYPLTPNFEGGSIHGVLPQVKLIEGLNQKGLFTRAGLSKPAAQAVARLFATLPAG